MKSTYHLAISPDGSAQISYDNPRIPICVQRGDLVSFPELSAPSHWHEDVELLLSLEGELSCHVDQQYIDLQEGDALFINTRQPHRIFSTNGSNCHYLCVLFQPQLLLCANDEIQRRFVDPLLSSQCLSTFLLHRNTPSHRAMLADLMELDTLYRNKPNFFELQVISVLYSFWHDLYSLTEPLLTEIVATDQNLQAVKAMLEYIRAHYQEKLRLDEIATAGAVCRTRCCQLFQRYLNQSPNEYLNSYRLDKAMYLLRSSGMSITEIAAACGYSSLSYFTELFTRTKGCSPSKFRKS